MRVKSAVRAISCGEVDKYFTSHRSPIRPAEISRLLYGVVRIIATRGAALSILAAFGCGVASFAENAQVFPSSALWTVTVSARPVAAPVASDNRLFLALQSGISARRIADGSEVWLAAITADGPIAIVGDRLVVPSADSVHVLEAANGVVAWTARTGRLTAPVLAREGWLVTSAGDHLSAFRMTDGAHLWTQDIGAVAARPAADGALVYVPVADGRLLALELVSGKPVWEFEIGVAPTEPLAYGNRVYVGSAGKRFCSLTVERGREIWCFPVGAAVVGKAAADESRVYYVALDNLLRAHDLNNGQLRWWQDLKYRPSAGPVVVGKTVTAPGLTAQLRGFNVEKGTAAHSLTLPSDLAALPLFIVPADGRPATMAALAGGLQRIWTLTLAGPPSIPAPLPLAPLTVLPGLVRDPGGPPSVHPEPPPPAAGRPPRSGRV
jgi:outer membrane protein assembly factor BamB